MGSDETRALNLSIDGCVVPLTPLLQAQKNRRHMKASMNRVEGMAQSVNSHDDHDGISIKQTCMHS